MQVQQGNMNGGLYQGMSGQSVNHPVNQPAGQQPVQQVANGDLISQLPVDEAPPSPQEVHLVNTLFKEHKTTLDLIAEESKDSVIIACIIILLTLPQVNELINRFVPMTVNSVYIMALVKGIAGGILFWIIKYFYLSRKNN